MRQDWGYAADSFRYNRLLTGKQYGEAVRLLEQYNEMVLEAQTDEYSLKNQMKNMLYHLMDFMQIPEETKDNCRYKCFKGITQAAYRKDLKLENLAEEFNFSYHYLSVYFSQQMNFIRRC